MLGAVQGKYAVGPFTDKARIEDYIREKHPGMIGIFPAMAGFYTVFASMPHLRPKCAPATQNSAMLQLLLSSCRICKAPSGRDGAGSCCALLAAQQSQRLQR